MRRYPSRRPTARSEPPTVAFAFDVKTGEVYFFDVNLFNIHADFVLGVLLKQAWTYDNVKTYNQNYERVKPKFILGYLTHHLKVDKWTFSFWEGDKIGPDDVMRVHKKLDETFWQKNMPFRPDSPMQEKVAVEVQKRGLKTVTNNEIYKAADFQAFNKGKTVGKLRIVPVGTPFESLVFSLYINGELRQRGATREMIFSPEMIILGGSVMRSAAMLMDGIRNVVRQNCAFVPHEKIEVRVASLGPYTGLIGAARVWHHRFATS